ncbi:MAG: DUF5702 domain-containing protein [Lachnospiraceae bacterium]|nr:DUF5702 domain-containing protein [Lachnospiraceae bacterium]
MKKGSITLALCLVLCALLSLIGVSLVSARHAAGRVVLASAAEQGMYSLFSRFDRTLFDTFGILALDGGYNGSELKLGSLKEEAEEVAELLTGSSGSLTGPTNLMHLTMEKGEVSEYILLTDGDGALFREQIARAVTGKKTAAAIQKVREQIAAYTPNWRELDEESRSIDADGTEAEYRNLKSGIAEGEGTVYTVFSDRQILCGTEDTENTAVLQETAAVQEPAVFQNAAAVLCDNAGADSEEGASGGLIRNESENPVEIISALRRVGLLNLVLPNNRTLSEGTIEADRVSSRTLQQGMGIIPDSDGTAVDKVLVMEYLLDSFQDFTEAEEGISSGLHYQVEYAIGKKESDAENLKAVLNRLLIIREASNYLYLLKDPVKQGEVQSAAITVSSLIGLPVAEPVVAEMLRLSWAYGESILDLRELLKGGKIPLMKDASSWQLSLNRIGRLQDEITEEHSAENGLTYQWYLRLLLTVESEEDLTESLMDLMEHRIRNTAGREQFRLDNCLVSMTILFRAKQEPFFTMEAERTYDYIE